MRFDGPLFLLLCQLISGSYSANTPNDPCQYPLEKGPCLQNLFRYYYDRETDECRRFTYSGCGGNANRFIRRQQCRQKCVKDQNKRDTDLAVTPLSPGRNPVLERIFKMSQPSDQVPKKGEGHLNGESNFALKSSTNPPSNCPICDPLYGRCVNGECQCAKGFKPSGRICIDVNECDLPNSCPPFANCTNTFGSFRCDCPQGKCDQAAEICDEIFDRRLADECDGSKKEKRFYYDAESTSCKDFIYMGCESKSRNHFSDQHECEKICSTKVKEHYKEIDASLEKLARNEEGNVAIGTKEIPITTITSKGIETTTLGEDKPFPQANPNHDICLKPFDEILRLECIEATWAEKFFWNPEIKDCEAFWYDTSCDPKDLQGKNFFDSSDGCLKRCNLTDKVAIPPISNDIEPITATTRSPEIPKREPKLTVPTETWTLPLEKADDSWITRASTPQSTTVAPTTINKDFPQIPPLLVTYPPEITEKPKEIVVEVEKVALKPADPCLESLDPRLEEDCNGDQWEIRWHFNPQKKSCKRFWWAGCKSESKNFFETQESCKELCDHRFVSENDHGMHFPISQIENDQVNIETTEKPIIESTTTPKITERTTEFVEKIEFSSSTTPSTTTTTTMATTKLPELTKKAEDSLKTDEPIYALPTSESSPPESRFGQQVDPPKELNPSYEVSRYDPCKDEFDPKFEEDCSEDNWVSRSYFDADKSDCRRFWYGGCATRSQNLFADQYSCRTACSHLIPTNHPPAFMPPIDAETNRIVYESTEFPLLHLESPDLHQSPNKGGLDFELEPEDQNENQAENRVFYDFPVTQYEDSVIESSTLLADEPYRDRPHRLRKPKFTPRTNRGTKSTEGTKNLANFLGFFTKSEDFSPISTSTPGNSEETLRLLSSQMIFDEFEITKPVNQQDFSLKSSQNITFSLEDNETQVISTLAPLFSRENPAFRLKKVSFSGNSSDSQVVEGQGQTPKFPKQYSEIDRSLEAMDRPLNQVKTDENGDKNSQIPVIFDDLTHMPKANSDSERLNEKLEILKSEKPEEDPVFVYLNGTSRPDSLVKKRKKYRPPNLVSPEAFKLKATVTTRLPGVNSGKNTQKITSNNQIIDQEALKPRKTPKIIGSLDQEPLKIEKSSENLDQNLLEFKKNDEFAQKIREASQKETSGESAVLSRRYSLTSSGERLPENQKYSERSRLPLTIAEECLDDFDASLTRSCMYEKQWKNRYYFDKDTRACRMFWWDGCFSSSRNVFSDEETCKWKCLGAHPKPEGSSCLDAFDTTYLGDCRHGRFEKRFYFDFNTKKCNPFHWGGCRSDSRNIFEDIGECQRVCEQPPRELVQSCLQPFDRGYESSCLSDGRFHQYYYYDMNTHTCKMFWYGNCRRTNQNIFPSLSTCQWVCERETSEKKQDACLDEFDKHYEDSCGQGLWIEKWRFDHSTGLCRSFWFDQCVSSSQNIFADEATCRSQCERPGLSQLSHLGQTDKNESNFRCLEAKVIGECKETYPAYHYDRQLRECRPFSYSGCGGNGNRFLTIGQCQHTCFDFNSLTDPEMDCFEPLDIGYGRNEIECIENAGFRFYFDRDYGACSKFWYLGCGGNANNFYSFDVCQRTCRNSRRLPKREIADISVCFDVSAAKGHCHHNDTKPVQRWTYMNGKCGNFSYSGCGGSSNRFSSQHECESTCKGLKRSIHPTKCSHEPDWGTCNHMRYMWFYDSKIGTCGQFLYGGCGGNSNRFETFEDCQKECEPSGFDPCMEHLDRGRWCEDMSNRYYYNKKMKECKGFHYTGCGNSNNNFHTLEECEARCVRRPRKSKALPENPLLIGKLHEEEQNSIENRLKEAQIQVAIDEEINFNLTWVPTSTMRPTRASRTTRMSTSTGTPKKGTRKPDKYAHRKPTERTPMLRHEHLNGVNRTYLKTEPEWHHYETCLGYRYNVSGSQSVLKTHLCDLDGNRHCWSEIHESTDGEELCIVIRPFLRDVHLYSWFFELTTRPHDYSPMAKNRREQRRNETLASILLLKANRCFDIC